MSYYPHPLDDKATMLARVLALPSDMLIHHQHLIGVFFPEVLFQYGIYKQVMMDSYEEITSDRTIFYLEQWAALQSLLMKYEPVSSTIQPLESSHSEVILSLLTHHYYYCGMFEWFWRYFSLMREHDATLYARAAEVSFFEQRPMHVVEHYLKLAFQQRTKRTA